MKDLRADISILAQSSDVWRVLTDVASFPEWNPYLREVRGPLRPGARLTVSIHPPGTRVMSFQATVLKIEANHELVWLGRFWGIRGLLEAEQHFAVETLAPEAVRLTQRAYFRGILTVLPPLSSVLSRRLLSGMSAMNRAVKERTEHAT